MQSLEEKETVVFEIIQAIELKDAKERIEYSLKLLSNK